MIWLEIWHCEIIFDSPSKQIKLQKDKYLIVIRAFRLLFSQSYILDPMTILEESGSNISERDTMISSVGDRYITPEYLAPLPTNVRITIFFFFWNFIRNFSQQALIFYYPTDH